MAAQACGPPAMLQVSSCSMQAIQHQKRGQLSALSALPIRRTVPFNRIEQIVGGAVGSSFLSGSAKWRKCVDQKTEAASWAKRPDHWKVQAATGGERNNAADLGVQIDRRHVLIWGGAAAAGLLLPSQGGAAPIVMSPQDLASCDLQTGCCVNVSNSIPTRVPFTPLAGPVRTRKATRNLSDQERRMFNRAYELLRQKARDDPTDPRWYAQQANVHCAYCNMFYQYSFDGNAYPLQVHGSWFFLPWHRLYLHFHERILISLLKTDPEFSAQADSFALPFWNYDILDAASPDSVTAAIYRNQTALPALYNPRRTPRDARSLVSFAPGPAQDAATTIRQNTAVMRRNVLQASTPRLFFGTPLRAGGDVDNSQAGQLEGSPHGPVHIWVGGDMSQFTTAGRDPIFYGHHGNLDRLWSVWLNLPGGNRVNYDDPDWLTSSFLFWDENRNLVEAKVSDAIDTRASLRYAYEDVPIPWATAPPAQPLPPQPSRRSLLSADEVAQKVDLGPATADSRAVPLNKQPLITSIQRSPPADLKGGRDPGAVGGFLRSSGVSKLAARVGVSALTVPNFQEEVLVLQGVSYPSNQPTHFNVFINLPDANPGTPLDCAEYAGSFTAVAHGAMDMTSSRDVRISISDVLDDLGLTDTSDFTVTIVPVVDEGGEQEYGDVSIKGIAIEYDS